MWSTRCSSLGWKEQREMQSEPESVDFDDEVDDPSFVLEEELLTLFWGLHRGKDGVARLPGPDLHWLRPQSPASVQSPGRRRRMLIHSQSVQLEKLYPHSQKDHFLLFWVFFHWHSKDNLQKHQQECCKKQGIREEIQMGWWGRRSVHVFGLLLYMSLLSLPSLQDYWIQNYILSVPLPAKVMTRERFRSIIWNIHLSDLAENVEKREHQVSTNCFQ